MKQSNSRNSAFQLTASQGGWPHLAGWPLSVPYFNSQPHKEADKDVIVPSRPIWYFNSQPHKEADFGSPSALIYTLYFNSQPHKEADVSQHTRCFGIWTFQLTASQGGWRDRYSFCPKRQDFNSQPHKEADRLIFMHSHQANLFQLTASQGGWRWNGDMYGVCRYISTHSLTRRLTRYRLDLRPQLYISTHSLTRRLTGQPDTTQNIELISTHSLTRRLTEYLTAYSSRNWYFNSQPLKEADSNFRQKHIYPKLIFLLIIHISLIFYSNHHILNYFSCKLYVFPGANVLEYFCELTFRTIILRYL